VAGRHVLLLQVAVDLPVRVGEFLPPRLVDEHDRDPLPAHPREHQLLVVRGGERVGRQEQRMSRPEPAPGEEVVLRRGPGQQHRVLTIRAGIEVAHRVGHLSGRPETLPRPLRARLLHALDGSGHRADAVGDARVPDALRQAAEVPDAGDADRGHGDGDCTRDRAAAAAFDNLPRADNRQQRRYILDPGDDRMTQHDRQVQDEHRERGGDHGGARFRRDQEQQGGHGREVRDVEQQDG